MAKKRRKKVTEEKRIIRFLENEGFHEITEEEKKEPWYQEHLKQLERWRKEEVGKPFTVKERSELYSPKKSAKNKMRV